MASPFGLRKRKYSPHIFQITCHLQKVIYLSSNLQLIIVSAQKMIFRRLILPYEWIVCQCYIRTTQSFDFLHSFMICRHCSDFRYTESQNFRILNCACVQNTKPNGKHKMKRRQKKITFLLASHKSTQLGIPPLFPYLIYFQNKTICTEVGQSARRISPDWTTRIRIRILC